MKDKLDNIRVLLTDVDGVLTDGGMYYTNDGDVMKRFHTRDGMGITLLRKIGIPTIIITKEKTKFVRLWAKKMKVENVFDGVDEKEKILTIICKKYHISAKQVAYIGDDVNDMKLLKIVGYSATPYDGTNEVKKIVNHICKNKGGEGVLREIADMIRESQIKKKYNPSLYK